MTNQNKNLVEYIFECKLELKELCPIYIKHFKNIFYYKNNNT